MERRDPPEGQTHGGNRQDQSQNLLGIWGAGGMLATESWALVFSKGILVADLRTGLETSWVRTDER